MERKIYVFNFIFLIIYLKILNYTKEKEKLLIFSFVCLLPTVWLPVDPLFNIILNSLIILKVA